MDSSKLNDWLQIAAAVGVIAGLALVAYEIRISNRIGIEQGNAAALERWDTVQQLGASSELAAIFVRAYEGDELSRAEAFMLNSFTDQVLSTVNYDLQLAENETLASSIEEYQGTIQLYVSSDFFRRRWKIVRNYWDDRVVEAVDQALAAPEQRDVVAYLDYVRGVAARPD